ncbi:MULTISPECIES: 4Fe-4S binding protein [Eubacteriales]|uniref:4Fe-4S binding protein n=1 Tax=Clostridium isatidis TaxID=182773 RepID=A0A343JD21_9CLOT|nr:MULTISPECIES: 4Fe-4S binding protein [Eubacteriales]ASW43429.1 4Fe-4S binding protein [Clostridium isatidis]MBU5454181.1 4Fe-4S binding protein [Caproiciproducens sp. MSJ-32]NLZ34068.1 4Fe-4S binding protein [Clostridiales bacterium]
MGKLLKFWKRYSYVVLFAFIILSLFDLRFALAAIGCMLGPVVLSIFKGRFWCGNICPRGSFYDNLLSKISNNKKAPKFLKSNFFRILVVILMMSIFAVGISKNWGNLYGIGLVFYRMIVITSIIGIVLSFFYNSRTWCNFCPMGTIASFISRIRKGKRLLKVSTSCVSCKICEKQCYFGIAAYEYKGNLLSHPDCIQCGKCLSACPKKSISY